MQATQIPARHHTRWSSLEGPPKGEILMMLLLLSVKHWKVYTEDTEPVRRVYLKPRGIKLVMG